MKENVSKTNKLRFVLKLKLTMLFLFGSFLGLQANDSFSQSTVTLDLDRAKVSDILDLIENQTEYRFVYKIEAVNLNRKITMKVTEKEVSVVLDKVFKGSQTNYKIFGRQIFLVSKGKPVGHANPMPESKPPLTVSGIVTEAETGKPVAGVNILQQGTDNGVVTGLDGSFTIQVADDAVLLISSIGYATQKVPVNGRKKIDIVLETETAALEEVVIVGYGMQKKANLTGAVTSIDSKTLESRPVQNTSQMLQGVMPGLNIQSSGLGGELNSEMDFNIRGTGSIGEGSESSPLVLIDGMEANLNAINPNDIASVTVLKDAAAASIYGSRAAFGVILITTKTGKPGKPRVNYSNNLRLTSPLGLPSMMDSYTFALYWNEAAANDNSTAKYSPAVLERIQQFQRGELKETNFPTDEGIWYETWTGTHANNDWFDVMYKDYGFAQEHNANVSGGSEYVNYYVSANYLDQEGLLRYSNDQFNRYGLTSKINIKLSDHVKFNTSTRYIQQDYEKATHQSSLFYHNIARRWPTVPVVEPDGSYSYSSQINELRDGGRSTDKQGKIYFQGEFVITPVEGWDIYLNGNYNTTNINKHVEVLPAYSHLVDGTPYPMEVAGNPGGHTEVYEYSRKNDYFSSNLYSTYAFDLNDLHNFKFMAGFNTELHKYKTIGASRAGIIDPEKPTINTSTRDSKATEGQYQHWAVAGYFGRLNYNYLQKYLFELNLRYDGSSRFINDKRWRLFPSISTGWNVAKEEFWPWSKTIQEFKPRFSYGELGNQNTTNWYPFYSIMPIGTNNGSWLINGQQPNTASAPDLVSTLLTWERITNWNLGVDASLFGNRLSLTFEYFNRKTIDMVGPAPELPVVLGTEVPKINNADMKSTGFELEVSWKDVIGKVKYNVRAVLSDSRQKITRYPNETNNISTWYVGREMGEIWGYTTLGIAKTNAQMNAHLENVDQSQLGSNWQAGDIMFADLNGDGKIDGGNGVLSNTGDRRIIGNATPRYRYGLDINLNYEGFDARIFFQGIGKRDYMPGGPYFWGAYGGMWQSTGFEEHIDYYRDENSPMVKAGVASVNLDPYFPRPYFNTSKNQQTQTRYIQNAAYLRLKNTQVGYNFEILNKTRARVYISGENLLTFTKMIDIFDPETVGLQGWSDGKTYPYARVYSIGLSINF